MLSLKWDNHSWTFSQALSNIRSREVYSDATIVCDGKFYKVHKLIMSTCSNYLEQIFDKINVGSSLVSHPVIVLQDIKHEHLEALLDYMYIGEVNVRQADLPLLIKAAECLKIKGLAIPDDRPSEKQSDKQRNNRKTNYDKSYEKSELVHREPDQFRRDFASPKIHNSQDNQRDVLLQPSASSYEINRIDKKRLNSDNEFQEKNESHLEFRNSKIRKKEDRDPMCLEISLEHNEVKKEPLSGDQYMTNEPTFEPNFELNNHTKLEDDIHQDRDSIDQSLEVHDTFLDTRSTAGIQITPVNSDSQNSIWENQEQNQEQTSINSSIFFTTQQNSSTPVDINDIWQQAIQSTPGGVACPFCSKVYVNRSAFRYHYKTHTGEKPYACPHCPQRFILRGDMMKHIRTHTGEKPFACPHCSHTFIQKSNMKDHIYRHHPEANIPAPKRCAVMNLQL